MTTGSMSYEWRGCNVRQRCGGCCSSRASCGSSSGSCADSDLDSAVTIGYLVGGYLIAGGVMEFVLIGVAEGWKWLHAVLGVLFVIGGIVAFTEPVHFGALTALVGFFLVVKGTFDCDRPRHASPIGSLVASADRWRSRSDPRSWA